MRRICPHPIQWNAIYERLLRIAEERPELPTPPIPLILNGWVFALTLRSRLAGRKQ
jgi:hypothetical protein